MSIRTRTPEQRAREEANPEAYRLIRKADQCDELASLALQDGDKADAERKFAEAKEYRRLATELL